MRGKVKHAVLLGQDAAQLATVLKDVCSLETVSNMEQAVQAAAQRAEAGDIVLLSPACASLDMFRDYGHRGDVFAAAGGADSRRDPDAAADTDALRIQLPLLHRAGDRDHRPFMRLELPDQLLGPCHPQMHALAKVDPRIDKATELERFDWIRERQVLTLPVRAQGLGVVAPARLRRLAAQIAGPGAAAFAVDQVFDGRFLPALPDRAV